MKFLLEKRLLEIRLSTTIVDTMNTFQNLTICCLSFFLIYSIPAFSQKQNAEVSFVPNEIMVRMRSGYMDRNKVNAELHRVGCEVVWQALKPEESITFNPLSFSQQPNATRNTNLAELRVREDYVLRTFRVRYSGNESPEKMCRLLKLKIPAVEIAEPIAIETVFTVPNDNLLDSQKPNLDAMKVLEAWEITLGDSNYIIAIVDNGIDITHIEFENKLAINNGEIPNDSIDNDGNGYVDDYKGVNLTWREDGSNPNQYSVEDSHGTQAAGNACAMPDNKTGGIGTGFRSKLLAVKAGKMGSTGIFNGYEGIMYAAKRNVQVISCSWGTPNFYSAINNSIIQYAISKGCAVVAAAGNTSDDSIYYPSNYNGVLGVGNSYYYDQKALSSTYGVGCDIMAPGENFFTVLPNNAYGQFNGTSSACPLVAGIVAVTMAKFPEYSGVQICEHVRRTGDKMDEGGRPLEFILPERVNMLNAVTKNPFGQSAIVYNDVDFYVRKGQNNILTNKFEMNDTVDVVIKVENRLAKATDIRFTASQPYKEQGSITMVDSVHSIASMESAEKITLPKFSFVVQKASLKPELLRISIEATTQKPDFFLINFVPTNDMTDFSTDSLTISAGDNGYIGFAGTINNEDRRGNGLELTSYGNFIYNGSNTSANNSSGFIVTYADSTKAVSAFSNSSDFRATQTFSSKTPTVRIIDDSVAGASTKIGVEIYTDFAVNNNVPNAIKIIHKLRNMSGKPLNNIALGYFFDLDIGPQGSDNKAALFPEAIPDGCIPCAAEIVSRGGIYPFVGFSVRSEKNEDVPAAVGVTQVLDDDIVSLQEKIALLNSGTAVQTSTIGDIQVAIGTKFTGAIAPNENRSCEICMGSAWTKEELAQSLKDCMTTITNINEYISEKTVSVFPNPATHTLYISTNGVSEHKGIISDLFGRTIYEFSTVPSGNNAMATVPTEEFQAGVYFVRIGSYTEKIIINK